MCTMVGGTTREDVHYKSSVISSRHGTHLPITKEVLLKKSQRKALLIRRKWRRVREKRVRAYTKAFLRSLKGGSDVEP